MTEKKNIINCNIEMDGKFNYNVQNLQTCIGKINEQQQHKIVYYVLDICFFC